jgi:hypothetical protein
MSVMIGMFTMALKTVMSVMIGKYMMVSKIENCDVRDDWQVHDGLENREL